MKSLRPKEFYLGFKKKSLLFKRASLVAQKVKNPPAMQETQVRSLGRGRYPGEGKGNPLQYFSQESSMDRGAWWPIAHGLAKSRTRLSDTHAHTHTHAHTFSLSF